nr:DUF5590 domain-containing protein [Cohnella algarum]
MTVRNADADYRRDEAEAIELAKTEAGLTSIDSAVKHVWEETVWVVIGKDAEGVARIVWVRESGAANDALANGLSQDQAEQRFASERPGAKIVRILPGWFQDRPAWEIRYVADPETERQAIDFYAFEDGAKLKTYELPGRTAG